MDYVQRGHFEAFDEHISAFGLVQLIEFGTWSRLVENTLRSSILDHVYSYKTDPAV